MLFLHLKIYASVYRRETGKWDYGRLNQKSLKTFYQIIKLVIQVRSCLNETKGD